MASPRIYHRSFAGGEVSPQMYARLDDGAVQSGAQTMRNMICKPQGPAFRRPGTRFVHEVRTSANPTRLIPFSYSTDQTMVIEIGVGYFRFHTAGATLLSGSPRAFLGTGVVQITSPGSVAVITWSVGGGNATNHNFENLDVVVFPAAGTPPAPIAADTPYYVRNKDATTFNISLTPTGALIDATSGSSHSCQRSFSIADLVSYGGDNYYCIAATYAATVPSSALTFWYKQGGAGEYQIPNTYAGADLFDIHYVQSNDVLTLVCRGYPAAELRRYGATDWRFAAISFAPVLTTPTISSVTAYRGVGQTIVNCSASATGMVLELQSAHGFITGDNVYISGVTWTSPTNPLSDGFYIAIATSGSSTMTVRSVLTGVTVDTPGSTVTISNGGGTNPGVVTYAGHNFVNLNIVRFTTSAANLPAPLAVATSYYVRNANIGAGTFELSLTSSGSIINTSSAGSGTHRCGSIYTTSTGKVYYAPVSSDNTQTYKVTALNDAGDESEASAESSGTNNLYVSGAYNTVAWAAITGATRYRVYKEQTGLFGFIGETTDTSFIDDNIGPDLGVTPPEFDESLDGTDYPGAVSYFEQRRVFAGTTLYPQDVWLTRSGTESDLTFGIPVRDSDRIYFRLSSRESAVIRHVIPTQHLLLFTSSGEYRVTPINDDALTPGSVSVRPQSYVGSSAVQPSLVNNTIVFCAARGGHVRELGYRAEADGFVTGDLSLRAAHLFDGETIVDQAYQKAPLPILWFVSSTGRLLGLTYIPEEGVGAWHWHDTDGTFESVCVVSEGDEDRVYVVVARTIDSGTVRYIERMGVHDAGSDVDDAYFVDCGITYDSTASATISGLWHLRGETVSVLADGFVEDAEVVGPVAGTATFTHGTDTVNWSGHPLGDDDPVYFTNSGGGVPAELAVDTVYYARDVASGTFKVAATAGGAVVAFTDNGTGTTTAHYDPLATTVTFTNATEIVNWTGHPLSDGDPIYFTNSGGDVPAELAVDTIYFVRDSAADTFKVAATSGGAAVAFTDDGTGTTTIHYDGAVTLAGTRSTVQVGLPFTSQIETLPLSVQVDGYASGHTKNVNKVWVRVEDSGDFEVGPNTTDIVSAGLAVNALTDEVVEVVALPSWTMEGTVIIQQEDPLPLVVVGLTIEASLGGG